VFLGIALAICTSAIRLVDDDAGSRSAGEADDELAAPEPVAVGR
jgi:hypothetical protein